ncbi:MAG TPA: sulfatase [Lentisphaeria bacterium]|nr:MAG: sulfatase [Lentisphaerae bacterium GWF2_50_93]HCE45230.1 sulfatase [Lentisphaeria bacterium]
MRPVNILYVHSHDTGRYIEPYGHAIHTPRLKKLAEEGVLFRQAFTASPTCSPSRACLLTGQYAHSNGMLGLAHRGFSLNDYKKHIVHTLKEHGYTSALSGIQHVASYDSRNKREAYQVIGYDQCLTSDGGEAHEKASQFLDDIGDKPFFLSVGFFETHREFPGRHPDENAGFTMPPAPLPDTPEVREDMARFKQMARSLDRKVGVVLDALERNGLAGNTLVISTTDHGIAFPRMKCNLEDSGTGVMLLMRGPCGFSGGKVIDGMVGQIDIFPTICDLLEIPKPDWLQGKSFYPLITGEKKEVQDELFFEINVHAAYEPMRAVRTRRFKYIRRFNSYPRPVLPNCDAGLSKSVWLGNGWAAHTPDEEALFDLIFDPNETNNLLLNEARKNMPEVAGALADMRDRLENWMILTKDPLLGPEGLNLPEGAKLNPRSDTDPNAINYVDINDKGKL